MEEPATAVNHLSLIWLCHPALYLPRLTFHQWTWRAVATSWIDPKWITCPLTLVRQCMSRPTASLIRRTSSIGLADPKCAVSMPAELLKEGSDQCYIFQYSADQDSWSPKWVPTPISSLLLSRGMLVHATHALSMEMAKLLRYGWPLCWVPCLHHKGRDALF